MSWALWMALLALANGSGTLASRARNTPSFGYHASAAFLSHGVFFLSQVISVDVMVRVMAAADPWLTVRAFAAYTAASMAGSVGVHWAAMRYLETGNRRVGAYEPEAIVHEDGARTRLSGPPYPSAAARGDVVVVVPPSVMRGKTRRPAGW